MKTSSSGCHVDFRDVSYHIMSRIQWLCETLSREKSRQHWVGGSTRCEVGQSKERFTSLMLTDPFCSSEVRCSRDFGLWVLIFKRSNRVFGARGHMNFLYRLFFLRWRNENRELGVKPLLMDSWDCLMILGGQLTGFSWWLQNIKNLVNASSCW